MLLSAPMADGTERQVEAEARRLAARIEAAGLPLRLLGGLAIRLHAAGNIHPALARSYADIDLVCTRKAGREVSRFLVAAGYEANERFNAMNGSERMIFYDRPNARHIDVFVGGFRMCHALPLTSRLDRDSPTLPLAELLLTKLQVVQLNAKDANDIIALLLDHEVAEDDDDTVNAAYILVDLGSSGCAISDVCGNDRILDVGINIESAQGVIESGISSQRETVGI